jgi:hypothetical protein
VTKHGEGDAREEGDAMLDEEEGLSQEEIIPVEVREEDGQ